MKTTELVENTLVRVRWVDSNYARGWNPHGANTASLPEVVSVGFVTKATEEMLEISSHVGLEDGAKLNPLTIPAGAITSLEKLGKNGD